MRMRTRTSMLAAWVLIPLLIGGAAVLAQRPDEPAEPRLVPAPLPPKELPPPMVAPPDTGLPPPVVSPPDAADDPMQAVEEFVQRSRKEAEESIERLGKEADALRARLQKVEAALERWKAVQRSLKSELANAPDRVGQQRWKGTGAAARASGGHAPPGQGGAQAPQPLDVEPRLEPAPIQR